MKNGWVEQDNGWLSVSKWRYKDDLLHNETGPAKIIKHYNEKTKCYYYLYGRQYTKEDWEKEVLIIKLGGVK